MKAKVARFYGWAASEIELMPFSLFYDYYRAIEVVNSEEMLEGIEIAVSPHLKQEKFREVIKNKQRKIKMLMDATEGRQASIEDVAKAFARMGISGQRQQNNN